MFALLAAPAVLQRSFGGDTAPYIVTTIALALVTTALVAAWRDGSRATADDVGARIPATLSVLSPATLVVGAIAAVLLFVACRAWILQILTIPIDPYRGDMLVLIREGLRRMGAGLNPYAIHHVPWAAPLSYGPLLWGPYAIPMLLRADLRFLTVAGELFVPVACAVAAVASAARRRLSTAAAALVMLGAIGLNGSLEQFTSAAHTPVYWPLVALFAWLTVRERWRAAAVLLGLLVVARTTMIAVVPVLLMAVWLRDRGNFAVVCALVALSIGLPFLPFALWDMRALTYALYGVYEQVIKTVVWPDPTVPHTIGVTGVLLTHHLNRFVEAIQVATMAVVYAICWVLLRRGRAPIALMGTALLAFSATTLWPVTYIYFDVFLLFAAGVLADMPWLDTRSSTSRLMRGWAATLAVAVVLVGAFGVTMLRLRSNEQGQVTSRGRPNEAAVLLLRRTISPAIVDVRFGAASLDAQRMGVALNGLPLGDVNLEPGVDHVMLAIPASRWQLGANTLELSPEAPVTWREVIVNPTRSLAAARP